MNFREIIKSIKNIDKEIFKIMKNGIKFSCVFCLIAMFILVTYVITSSPNSYYIGILLFKTSLFFIVSFIVCGMAFNKIIKEI